MSKQPSDAFLPSGAVASPRKSWSNLSSSAISPLGIPRSVPLPDYIPSLQTASRSTPSPKTHMQSHHPSGQPLSPPKTRSPSAEDSSAALVEDWRAYTAKLRSQNEGERAHMAADRHRMEEVMAEERELWDKERKILNARIAELEVQLGKRGGGTLITPPLNHRMPHTSAAQHALSFTSPGSNAVSVTGSVDGSRGVPQESGRNADGTPFYAPAARNPSRTFEPSEMADLRVDSITAPRESAIRVTSREFTSFDFIQSPPQGHDLESIPEGPVESIDISHIQPGLEGVLIKTSAVSPTFVAKVLSPQFSPAMLSPSTVPPGRNVTSQGSLSRSNSSAKENKAQKTLEVVSQPENRRLIMHAGHTPSHSISRISWAGSEAEADAHERGDDVTPKQQPHAGHVDNPIIAPSFDGGSDLHDEDDQGDKELSGPLGLTNEATTDDAFLTQLVEKLEQARKSQPTSPSTESTSSLAEERSTSSGSKGGQDEEKDEGPVLKLKSSFNFGRPMGRM